MWRRGPSAGTSVSQWRTAEAWLSLYHISVINFYYLFFWEIPIPFSLSEIRIHPWCHLNYPHEIQCFECLAEETNQQCPKMHIIILSCSEQSYIRDGVRCEEHDFAHFTTWIKVVPQCHMMFSYQIFKNKSMMMSEVVNFLLYCL